MLPKFLLAGNTNPYPHPPTPTVCVLFYRKAQCIVAEEYYQLREPVINLPQHKAIHRTRVRAFQFHARGRGALVEGGDVK